MTLCIPRLRIAILNEEIELWEKRIKDEPEQMPFYNYIISYLKDRVKTLEDEDAGYDEMDDPYGG
tara:strand:+ start:232 stop:426 length:195 start_codon:yes stop_codon:yes gene_type:complete